MVDPCIWTDEGFLHSSLPARLLFIGLITTADDDGKGQSSAASLKAAVFPSDNIALDDIDKLKIELSRNLRVEFYEYEGRSYYRLCKWHNHQYVQAPKPSKIPDPPGLTECSDKDNVSVTPNTIQYNTRQDNVSGKKPGAEPAVKRLIDIYHTLYVQKAGQKPTVTGQWGRNLKTLLRAHTEETVQRVIHYFFDYPKRTQWGWNKFMASFDNLLPGATGRKPSPARGAGWKCPHCGHWNTQTGSLCFRCHKDRDDKET
jgi:hypothetical protein